MGAQKGPQVEGMTLPRSGGVQGGGYAALLRNRNYRLFFGASLISSVGDWAGLFALQIFVVLLAPDGSRLKLFALGALMMARIVPSLLVGPLAGVLADRYDRRRLIIFCDLVRGALFLGIAASGDLVALVALTFMVECLSLAFAAAKDASLPEVVDRTQLTEANQLNLLVTYGPLPLGALVTAAVTAVTALGYDVETAVRAALVVDAASFLVSGALFSRLRMPRRVRERAADGESRGVLTEMREGLEFIAGRPLIRSLLFGVFGVFFGAGVVVSLGPVFVQTELGRPETDWSLLAAAVGGGLALGIIAVRLFDRFVKAKVFSVALVLVGGIASLIATLPTFGLTLWFGFFLGATGGIAFVTGYTLLHESTPDDVRGKTFGALYTGTRLALFASLGAAPFLAGAIGNFRIGVGSYDAQLSGTRAAILAGGLIGLVAATRAGRGMWRALRSAEETPLGQLSVGGEHPVTDGLLIAFEGVEGSGKSTQIRRLATSLRDEGIDVVVTREPGGAPVAERLRALVLDPELAAMEPGAEALLDAAARAEHVERVIRPGLEAGRLVLCDRFIDSSLAYQGAGRGLGTEPVATINAWAVDGLAPDAVVLLDLDAEEGLRRARARGRAERRTDGVTALGVPDRIEAEDLAFHRTVAAAFAELAEAAPDRFLVVDATLDEELLARRIRAGLERWLRRYRRADGAAPPTPSRLHGHG